jgi:hypothetical protein
VAVGRQGSVFVTDTRNNRLLALVPSRNTSRWLDSAGRNDCSKDACCQPECVAKRAPAFSFSVERLAGGQQGAVNGAGAAAQFDAPAGLALAPSGELMICDSDNGLVRAVAHVPPSRNGAVAVARVRTCPLRSRLVHAPAASLRLRRSTLSVSCHRLYTLPLPSSHLQCMPASAASSAPICASPHPPNTHT